MTPKRRRLLFLTPLVPAAGGNGLAIRAGFFLLAYSNAFDVDVAVLPIVAGQRCHAFARRHARRLEILAHPGTDSHFALLASLTDFSARLQAFQRFARPSLAAFAIDAAAAALADWTRDEEYDFVHVSRLYLAPVAERWLAQTDNARGISAVLDCDEDDSKVYRRLASIERRHGRRDQAAWAEAEADAFAQVACDVLPRFNRVFAASSDEARSLTQLASRPVEVIPNVVTCPVQRRHGNAATRRTVLFVGSMGYLPNEDAAHWLLTRIWPRLRRALGPRLQLLVVGRDPREHLIRLGRRHGVRVTGAVPNVHGFYRRADLVVVPIRAGGGTRIKLLEAAAAGVPVVSTAAGAAGTSFRHGRDLLIADDAERFARCCGVLLRQRDYAQRLGMRGRRRLMLDYSGQRWAQHLVREVASLPGYHLQ